MLSSIFSTQNVDALIEIFKNTLVDALNNFAPVKQVKIYSDLTNLPLVPFGYKKAKR